jgi:hypothetical protein
LSVVGGRLLWWLSTVTTDNWQPTTDHRPPTTGNWQLATGNWQPTTASPLSEDFLPFYRSLTILRVTQINP